ncbi:MAG: twin-arginine translocation signal domain-containing protein [Candidatus Bathyarchaeia archaeon]
MSATKDGATKTRRFTLTDLQQFDGLDGRPLYVVYKGRVYDLSTSRLWLQGRHMGMHTRSENLTETIKGAPHGEETILRFPTVGELAEVAPIALAPAPTEFAQKPTAQPVQSPSMERRDFLKLLAAAGGAATIAAVASTAKILTFIPKPTTQLSWPKITVANLNQLMPLTPVTFNYPLTNTPNFLVKLGVAADGGVGPDGDIVAFSAICQHLGCFYGFTPPGESPPCNPAFKAPFSLGYCCCHGSRFDFVHGAKVVGGPSPRPLPQVKLEFDASTGSISAIAMGPPTIFGHGPLGTADPALVLQYDLQGGDVVT